MKYSDQKPPNWDKLVELFGVSWKTTVVTYGETVHASQPISPDLEVHEGVHVRQQQEMGIEAWWERYYVDAAFRLEQEIEAYRAQYQFFVKVCPDRNMVFKFKDRIARDLASKQYGNCITYAEAFAAIAAKPQAVAA